jgi:hypothetical protein
MSIPKSEKETPPMESEAIASGAELVLRGFQQCLHLAAPLHPKHFAAVEDQLARLSIYSLHASLVSISARWLYKFAICIKHSETQTF